MDKHMLGLYLIKPSLSGGVAYGVSSFLKPGWNIYSLTGQKYNLAMFSFVAGFASSILTNVAHDYILPHLMKSGGKEITAQLFGAGVQLGGTAAMTYFVNPQALSDIGLPSLAIQAVASEIISTYLYDYFVEPML